MNNSVNDIISFSGPFHIKMISALANYLNDVLHAKDVNIMKVYRVFVELTQNVAFYSSKREALENGTIGIGTVKITENPDYIYCCTCNQIFYEHLEILQFNCQRINESTNQELKTLKEKLRRESDIKDSGAHIGLVSIALYSENKLNFNFDFNEIEKQYYFSIYAAISKMK